MHRKSCQHLTYCWPAHHAFPWTHSQEHYQHCQHLNDCWPAHYYPSYWTHSQRNKKPVIGIHSLHFHPHYSQKEQKKDDQSPSFKEKLTILYSQETLPTFNRLLTSSLCIPLNTFTGTLSTFNRLLTSSLAFPWTHSQEHCQHLTDCWPAHWHSKEENISSGHA